MNFLKRLTRCYDLKPYSYVCDKFITVYGAEILKQKSLFNYYDFSHAISSNRTMSVTTILEKLNNMQDISRMGKDASPCFFLLFSKVKQLLWFHICLFV